MQARNVDGPGIQLKRGFAPGHRVRAGAQHILFLAHDTRTKKKPGAGPGFNFIARERDDQK